MMIQRLSRIRHPDEKEEKGKSYAWKVETNIIKKPQQSKKTLLTVKMTQMENTLLFVDIFVRLFLHGMNTSSEMSFHSPLSSPSLHIPSILVSWKSWLPVPSNNNLLFLKSSSLKKICISSMQRELVSILYVNKILMSSTERSLGFRKQQCILLSIKISGETVA